MVHPNPEVQAALVRLNDALCSWERNTGRQSVLVIREQSGFVHRSLSGKPFSEFKDEVSDEQLFDSLLD